MSLASSAPRAAAEWPQTPARQSACSSCRTDSALRTLSEALLLSLLHFVHQAQLILHVMPDLVRDDVGAGKFAGRTEALRQFVEKCQVQINPLVARAIERPHRRAGQAAGGS